MFDKKGLELAISTIVIIVISLAVLIGLIFLIKNGFVSFDEGTDPFLRASGASAAREACGIACRAEDENTFCCESLSIGGEEVFCSDSRLGVDCAINCEGFECFRGENFIEIIMGVGSNKVNCQTLVPTQCLVVNGQYFYDNIEGFNYEEGYNYLIKVKRIQIYTPETAPADASLYKYELIEILSKQRD
ncbi:MAG: DUF4377 domain-containing protein [Nanoarchaeota archaeon]